MKKENNKTNNNIEIAEIFYKMAEILDMQNEKWKPQAYRIAAQTLESLGEDVSEIYKKGGEKAINELPGIGEAFTKKIVEYIKTRKINSFEKLKKTIPAGLYDIMNIQGVGPKKALLFYNELGIKNIEQLKKAALSGKIKDLPGFKEKSEENILGAIEMKKTEKGRISLKEGEKIAENIVEQLQKLKEIKKIVLGGSIRRKKSTIRDIDIIILTEKPEKVLSEFVKMNFVKEVLGKGKEKATIITKQGIQADIRVFTNEEFGAGLLYFTGDKQHNIWLRKIAIKKGLKLNEYGLFEKKTEKRIAGKSEEEIYNILGLSYISPEKRIGEVR